VAKVDTELLINSLRKSFLIHSYIYYRLGNAIVPDSLFDARARHLYRLQRDYPTIAKNCIYQDYFKDFDPATGMDIPDIPEIVEEAMRIVRDHAETSR
jgi:hypothetical protein